MPYSFNPLSSLGLDQSIPLDSAGKIPSGYLPSYVDDVEEYADLASFPVTGETGKIYVAIDTGFTYRWSGSAYVRINSLDSITGDVNVAADGISSIASGVIVDGDVNAAAAIAGTKIDPDFGSQTVETTGVFSAAGGAEATPSIAFTGDLDTGIYSPGADQVAISTNGTGRLFVDASGNVGVATDTPGALFEVRPSSGAATASIRSSASSATLALRAGPTAESIIYLGDQDDSDVGQITYNHTSNYLAFRTNAAEVARIDSSGRLGLGTSSPPAILSTKPSASTTTSTTDFSGDGLWIDCENTTDANDAYGAAISWSRSGLSASYRLAAISNVQTGADSDIQGLAFLVHNSNNNNNPLIEGMRITGAGNVGIGDTGPSETLTVKGASGVDPFSVSGPSSEFIRVDDDGRLLVGTSTASAAGVLVIQGNTSGPANAADVSFQTGTARTSIGANSRLATISFRDGDENAYASITARGDGTTGSGDYPGRLEFSTTADGASSPTERMRIESSGRILTFSESTASSLQVQTSVAAGTATSIFRGRHTATNIDSGTTSFYVWSNGDVVNTNDSYGAISDIKLKENIVDAGSQWDDFKAVRFRKYNFKEETGHETFTQLGVIAQELELVSPGLVTETPDLDEEGNDLGTTTKSVKYSILTTKALVALQEAMERIETLEAKIAALEAS